jgi:drug/metabolite transporter (DMT)-like permease
MALMSAFVKEIGKNSSTSAIIFWRNFLSLLFLMPWLFVQKKSLREQLKTKEYKFLAVRGVSNFIASSLYFYSLKFLPLSNATLLFNTMPLFVPLVSYFWQRVVIIKKLWWGLGLAFLGIAIALDPRVGLFQPATLLALAAAIFGAIGLLSLRLGHYTETHSRLMFYLFASNTLLGLVFSLFSFEKNWLTLDKETFIDLIFVGVFGFLYQIAVTLGSRFVPVRLGGVFIFFSVIFSFFIDHFVWKTDIALSTYIGCALVIFGSILKVILYPKDDLQFKT